MNKLKDDDFKNIFLKKLYNSIYELADFLSLKDEEKTKEIFQQSGLIFYKEAENSLKTKLIKSSSINLEKSLPNSGEYKSKMKI